MQQTDKIDILASESPPFSYTGFCSSCGTEHVFTGAACSASLWTILAELTGNGSFCPNSGNGQLSTDFLFGQSRGKMFGVMKCLDTAGGSHYLKAFSGQFNGLWQIDGWVPPLFDVDMWIEVNSPAEKAIKELGEEIKFCPDGSDLQKKIRRERKILSRALMKDLQSLYRVINFRKQVSTLHDIFTGRAGIPTGTGDCCAPKLFNFAATHDLIPLAISEFFWGRENRSGTRLHGHFYPPCDEKCRPLLGFMLCGLEAAHARRTS